ncbi:MHCK/EF2 kinase [Trypanosoma melophagium]|uniref:MHCK/EF2 kinase n=1 Tax=Trypanosoma melophagium TaxID=715481 RepID=UPI00351A0DC2|nr:MHCK/EF2 kinase [Trypanosoma melophagium]
MACAREDLLLQDQTSCVDEQNIQEIRLDCNKIIDAKNTVLSLPENEPTQCMASPFHKSTVPLDESHNIDNDSKCVEVAPIVPPLVRDGKKREIHSPYRALGLKNNVTDETLPRSNNSDACAVNAIMVDDKQTIVRPQSQLPQSTHTTSEKEISFSHMVLHPPQTEMPRTSARRPMGGNVNEVSEVHASHSSSMYTETAGDCTVDTSLNKNTAIIIPTATVTTTTTTTITTIPLSSPPPRNNQMLCVSSTQPTAPSYQKNLRNSAQLLSPEKCSYSTRRSISSCSTCECGSKCSCSRSRSRYSTSGSSSGSTSHGIRSSLSRTTFESCSSCSRKSGSNSDSNSNSDGGSRNYSDSCDSGCTSRNNSRSSTSGSNSTMNENQHEPAIFPLKNGSVDALPLGIFLDLHHRYCLKGRLSKFAESAVVYEWDTTIGVWTTVNTSVVIFPIPFAHGDMRASYYIIDINRFNCKMVAKRYRCSSVRETQYFDDVSMHTIANHWAKKFNSCMPPKPVHFLPAVVMELIDRKPPLFFAVEPQLDGNFTKYNNNSGYVPNEVRWTPQAFSHFTYHASKKKLMIVDIQGVNDIYTDPQILTFDCKGYGRGNLGREGMRLFIRSHKCNGVCEMIGIPRISYTRDIANKLPKDSNTVAHTVPCQESDENATNEILPPRSHGSTSSIFFLRALAQRSVPESAAMMYSYDLSMPVETSRRYPGFLKRMRLYIFRRFVSENNALRTNDDQGQEISQEERF